MRRGWRLALVAVLLGTGGCAHYYARQPDLARTVDDWIAAQEYQRAIDTLRLVEPDHPDYAALMAKRRALRSLLKGYEQGIAAQAEALAQQGLLAEALGVYERGLDILPHSEALKKGRADLLARRGRRLATLRRRLLLAEGGSLVHAEPIQEEIVRIDPGDTSARKKLTAYQEKARATAKILLYEGEQALSRGDYETASRYLATAQKLHGSPATETALQRLQHAKEQAQRRAARQEQRKEEARRARAEEARERTAEVRAHALADAYHAAMRKDDLLGRPPPAHRSQRAASAGARDAAIASGAAGACARPRPGGHRARTSALQPGQDQGSTRGMDRTAPPRTRRQGPACPHSACAAGAQQARPAQPRKRHRSARRTRAEALRGPAWRRPCRLSALARLDALHRAKTTWQFAAALAALGEIVREIGGLEGQVTLA